MGGTIARYVHEGVAVDLVCATNGDVGDVDPAMLNGRSVAQVRLDELECAARILGIRHVYAFGYRDSGMMGSAENDHPDCLWQAGQEDVARRITEIIRRVRPQVVVTFDPYGGYGHPDHIAIHRATLRAFHAAGDALQFPEQLGDSLAPYQPQKLYYATFPRTWVRIGVGMLRLLGRDPRRMGRNHDLDMQAFLDAALPHHARIDQRAYYDLWMQASACHSSQQGPTTLFPPLRPLIRQVLGWQSFHRAWPEVNGQSVTEHDLFEGVASLEESNLPR
jgi:LmbE family N-acetylglucosaminyl deacetylase